MNDLGNEFLADDHYAPALAEGWEQPDPTTYIFHIRQGVRWHNKAPLNGREFTAQDVEYNYHRLTGTGSGFQRTSRRYPTTPRSWNTNRSGRPTNIPLSLS